MITKQNEIENLLKELDRKTTEYKSLCDELEKLKTMNLNPNGKEFQILLLKFTNNFDDISMIKTELQKLQKLQ